jgi:hypothetical protein
MPFTPSHAVVALPFVRTPLVPAAIAIGAMTPDLPLFLRGVGLSYSFTHALANILWTSVVAFVLFVLWRTVLRPAVPELAPRVITQRLPEEWWADGMAAGRRAILGEGQRAYPALLAVSVLLGVLSHIVWDLFTHEGRWGVALIPALGDMWGPLAGFKWLQHGSSIFGLIVLAVWGVLWIRRRPVRVRPERRLSSAVRIAWWTSLPLILVIAWVIGLVTLGPLTAEFTVQHLAYRVLPPACAVWGAITLALCVALLAVRRR